MNDTDSEQSLQPDSEQRPQSTPVFRAWLLVPLLLCLIAVVIYLRHQTDNLAGQDSPAIGKPAPQIDLVRLPMDGTAQPIRAVETGKVTLIHCWGTWCGPCRMEYPELAAMTNELDSDPRFVFLSISSESGPGATFESLWADTRDYFESANVASTAYADPMGVTRRSLAERLENKSLFYPTSVLISGDGIIAGVWQGYDGDNVAQIKSVATELIAQCER